MEAVLIGRHPHLHAWQWESDDDKAKAKKSFINGIGAVVIITIILTVLHNYDIVTLTLQGMAAATGVIIWLIGRFI